MSENHTTRVANFFIKNIEDVPSRVKHELKGPTNSGRVEDNNRDTLIHLNGTTWCFGFLVKSHEAGDPETLTAELEGMKQGESLEDDNEISLCFEKCTMWQTDVRRPVRPVIRDSAKESQEMFILEKFVALPIRTNQSISLSLLSFVATSHQKEAARIQQHASRAPFL